MLCRYADNNYRISRLLATRSYAQSQYIFFQVRYGGESRSSASSRPTCDGTLAFVWRSPRQTWGPSCPYFSDRTPFDAIIRPVDEKQRSSVSVLLRNTRAAPLHGPVPRIRQVGSDGQDLWTENASRASRGVIDALELRR